MITRAQAEALLTLAESLEACERQGLSVEVSEQSRSLIFRHCDGGFRVPLVEDRAIRPMILRYWIAEETRLLKRES